MLSSLVGGSQSITSMRGLEFESRTSQSLESEAQHGVRRPSHARKGSAYAQHGRPRSKQQQACVVVSGSLGRRPRAGRRSRAARSLVLTILARAASTCLPSTPSPAPQHSPLATTTAPQPVRFRRLAALAALVVSCGRQRVRGRRRSFGKECACPAAERRGASATYALCHRSSGRPAGRTQAHAGKASRFWRRLGWPASSMWPNNALGGSRCRWCCITAGLVDPTAA